MLLRVFSLSLLALSVQAYLPAAVVFTDDFTYADGDISANPDWTIHSGTGNPVEIVSGAAVVQHGAGSRNDVNRTFADITTGIAKASFDIVVNATGPFTGTDFEYFAHFGRTSDGGASVSPFLGRISVVAPSGGGDYSLGVATFSSTEDAVTAQSFNFGDTVSVMLTYDTDNDQATVTVGGETISGADGNQPGSVNAFAFRQSTSSLNESITVDNLVVEQISAIPEPSAFALLTMLGGTFVVARRKRR